MSFESKYFTESELACPCCALNLAQPQLIVELDKIRDYLYRPVILSSVTRCPAHNLEVGGTPGSSHLTGWAADILVASDAEIYRVIDAIICGTNINRFGIYARSIHVDLDQKKNASRAWRGSY